MENSKIVFHEILDYLSNKYPGVKEGRMMSSPAIQYRSKIFAFYKSECMTFRLGRETDMQKEFGVIEYSYLSPFKTRPPLFDWFILKDKYVELWPEMAEHAFKRLDQG